MKVVVYKASLPYLDGGSTDRISTNIGCFYKKVSLKDKKITYFNYNTDEIVENWTDIEKALIRYRRLSKINFNYALK